MLRLGVTPLATSMRWQKGKPLHIGHTDSMLQAWQCVPHTWQCNKGVWVRVRVGGRVRVRARVRGMVRVRVRVRVEVRALRMLLLG